MSIVSKSELQRVLQENLETIVGRPVTVYLKSFAAKEVVDRSGTVRILLTLDVVSPAIRTLRAELNLNPYSENFNLHATFGYIVCHGRKPIVS